MLDVIRIKVKKDEGGQRLDRFLTSRLEGYTRSKVSRLIGEGNILLEGKKVQASHRTKPEEEFVVAPPEPVPSDIKPEEIPLDIVYEDSDIAIVNKQSGMVVHPAKGNYSGTLVNALLQHCKNLSGIGGTLRPGIVHRLDKETSGLIAVAKNDTAHTSLSAQLSSREMSREYLAVVRGRLKESKGKIDKPIGRHPLYRKKMSIRTKTPREAVTDYEVIESFKEATYLKIKLQTGRTHQVRVHMSSINHPLLGDLVYGKKKTNLINRPALHAAGLGFVHPKTGKRMVFTAPLPADFENLLNCLRKTG